MPSVLDAEVSIDGHAIGHLVGAGKELERVLVSADEAGAEKELESVLVTAAEAEAALVDTDNTGYTEHTACFFIVAPRSTTDNRPYTSGRRSANVHNILPLH